MVLSNCGFYCIEWSLIYGWNSYRDRGINVEIEVCRRRVGVGKNVLIRIERGFRGF